SADISQISKENNFARFQCFEHRKAPEVSNTFVEVRIHDTHLIQYKDQVVKLFLVRFGLG
ncbi:hypothetical protein, partial [Arcanobacterium phocae]|uniref:hypothetical protein n=1 Tax=Arcanobacterium phocae TaxID=131112 RepID=UPI001C0EB942